VKSRFWGLFIIAVLALPVYAQRFQLGTVTRMQTKDCTIVHGALATALGSRPQKTEEICPEYTLVSDKVVYMVVGKRSSQFMPLAEIIQFRLYKNELLVRVDDEKRESHFSIKEMQLRSDWEHDQVLRGKQLEMRLQADRNELRRQELKQELKKVADEYTPR
jgi:hypothetical protein